MGRGDRLTWGIARLCPGIGRYLESARKRAGKAKCTRIAVRWD
jgi:hypothetical protein